MPDSKRTRPEQANFACSHALWRRFCEKAHQNDESASRRLRQLIRRDLGELPESERA